MTTSNEMEHYNEPKKVYYTSTYEYILQRRQQAKTLQLSSTNKNIANIFSKHSFTKRFLDRHKMDSLCKPAFCIVHTYTQFNATFSRNSLQCRIRSRKITTAKKLGLQCLNYYNHECFLVSYVYLQADLIFFSKLQYNWK